MDFADFFPIWNTLKESERDIISRAAFDRKFPKDTVLSRGTECTGLLLIRSGQIRAYTTSEEGKEITLYRLFERDICLFSASCMLNSLQFEITLATEKDSVVTVIPAEIYKTVMTASAPLANFTNEIMASRFSDVMWLVEQIMWKSLDKRLASFLLEEAAIEGGNTLKITHEIIGNHLGSPREVVTRMLRYFASEGLVKLARGTIEIADETGLRTLAG